jgi:hypothetical protein
MVLDDEQIKVHEIAETIGISKERVEYIFHKELYMKKLCARWVLNLLTADQEHTRMKISEQCLERFNKNKTDFVHRFVTMDETWIQQERSWHRCFGMMKAICLLIILKRVKQ